VAEKGAFINGFAIICVIAGMIFAESEMHLDAAICSILALILFGINGLIKRKSNSKIDEQVVFQNTQPMVQQHQNYQQPMMQQQLVQQPVAQQPVVQQQMMLQPQTEVPQIQAQGDDWEEQAIAKAQNRIWQMMLKNPNNLWYIILGEAVVGLFTWIYFEETEDEYTAEIVLPTVLICFGLVIMYTIWYWKRGPGALALRTYGPLAGNSTTQAMQSQVTPTQFQNPQMMTQQVVQQPMAPQQFQQQQTIPIQPISCPNCGTINAPNSNQCSLCLMSL